MGGDFILDKRGNFALVHRSVKSSLDRPTVDQIIAALRVSCGFLYLLFKCYVWADNAGIECLSCKAKWTSLAFLDGENSQVRFFAQMFDVSNSYNVKTFHTMHRYIWHNTWSYIEESAWNILSCILPTNRISRSVNVT